MSEDDNINFLNNEWVISGKYEEERALPEKYALGNIGETSQI